MNESRWIFQTVALPAIHPGLQRRFIRRQFHQQKNDTSAGLRLGGVFTGAVPKAAQAQLDDEQLRSELRTKQLELERLKRLSLQRQSLRTPLRIGPSWAERQGSPAKQFVPVPLQRFTKFSPKVSTFNPIIGAETSRMTNRRSTSLDWY